MSLDCALCEKRSLSSCLHSLDTLVSSFVTRRDSHNKNIYLACLSLMAIYLFIPTGSLRVYVDTLFGMVLIAILQLSAQSLKARGVRLYSPGAYQELDDFEHIAMSQFTLCFIIAGGCIAMYQLARGIPGNMASLDGLTAMPFWTVVGPWGVIGFGCFFLMFAIADPVRGRRCLRHYPTTAVLEVYEAVKACMCPALAVAMFIPWNPAISLGMSRVAMFSFDYAFFWLKVLLLQLFIFPALRKLHSSIGARLSIIINPTTSILLWLLGAAALYADYLLV